MVIHAYLYHFHFTFMISFTFIVFTFIFCFWYCLNLIVAFDYRHLAIDKHLQLVLWNIEVMAT